MGLNELFGGQFLAIDDVSFSKEPCKQIPWKQAEGETRNVALFHVIHEVFFQYHCQ